jgi:hypothetical protein
VRGPTTECTVYRAPVVKRSERTLDDSAEQNFVQHRTVHRDEPVACRECGKRIRRKGRTQIYCSRRCRQRAYLERRYMAMVSRFVTHHTARSTTSHKSLSKNNGLERRKSRSTSSFAVPLNLVGGGLWCWPNTPHLDPETRTKVIRAEIGGRFVRPSGEVKDYGGS